MRGEVRRRRRPSLVLRRRRQLPVVQEADLAEGQDAVGVDEVQGVAEVARRAAVAIDATGSSKLLARQVAGGVLVKHREGGPNAAELAVGPTAKVDQAITGHGVEVLQRDASTQLWVKVPPSTWSSLELQRFAHLLEVHPDASIAADRVQQLSPALEGRLASGRQQGSEGRGRLGVRGREQDFHRLPTVQKLQVLFLHILAAVLVEAVHHLLHAWIANETTIGQTLLEGPQCDAVCTARRHSPKSCGGASESLLDEVLEPREHDGTLKVQLIHRDRPTAVSVEGLPEQPHVSNPTHRGASLEELWLVDCGRIVSGKCNSPCA
mmetsp:Transcript_26469/g.87807  ORF Transcript_26469/g.87807 Transcript_26469/m.87807 type:complete len:322 (-) Transcript_26469:801-1766(-)